MASERVGGEGRGEKNDGMLTVFGTQDTAGHLREGPCSG